MRLSPKCDSFQWKVPPEWRQRSPRTTHSQKILGNPSRSVSLISLKMCSPTSCGQLTRLWLQNWQAELYSFLASQQLNTYQNRSQPRGTPRRRSSNACGPLRVRLGDLPQGVSLPPDCGYIGRNMDKHIRSVGWENPFRCELPSLAKKNMVPERMRLLGQTVFVRRSLGPAVLISQPTICERNALARVRQSSEKLSCPDNCLQCG